jgi:hypothetical protein
VKEGEHEKDYSPSGCPKEKAETSSHGHGSDPNYLSDGRGGRHGDNPAQGRDLETLSGSNLEMDVEYRDGVPYLIVRERR